ncbi:ABC transporter permease [Gemmatimonas sp.]|uniref:ABC transporter permease n=1 Tax=Gemmatimonas sp. TaxID=1962908 RepID=UPI0025BDD74C|nr:ABC transporter permease [Gemmatimonas sp.]MCA2993152.1 ABC transporter permease [Gemmatimonas sp.]
MTVHAPAVWPGRWSPALLVLAALVLCAVAAPLIAPYAPDALDLANRRAAPSAAHWFGTDELGRDVFTRVLSGARVSLAIGLLSALVSAGLGTVIGSAAGMLGHWADDLLMRVTDAMLSMPRLPLLMLAAAIVQPTVPMLIGLVALSGWMETARVVRADVQSLATRDFVQAARAVGAAPFRVWRRHLLPAVVPTLSVATTLAIGRAILLESTLSFFGVGVQPPTASWGNMLYQAQSTMSSEPWLAIFPGLFIFITVLACNTVGDALGETPRRSSP